MALGDEGNLETERIGNGEVIEPSGEDGLIVRIRKRIDLLDIKEAELDCGHIRRSRGMEDERTADQRAKQKEPVNAGSFCSGITASVDSLAAGNLRRDALKTVTTHGHHLLHPVRCWLALR